MSDTSYTSIQHNIENLDKPIKLFGIGYQDNGDAIPIPYIYEKNKNMDGTVSLYMNKNQIILKTYIDRTDIRAVITVEYTKNE